MIHMFSPDAPWGQIEPALVYVLHLHEIVMNNLWKYRINIRKLVVWRMKESSRNKFFQLYKYGV